MKRFLLSLAFAAPLAACATYPVDNTPTVTTAGAVSAADPRAAAAGEAMLAKGGSATDAAIAVMLALTVVEPQSSGIGGGGFMIRSDGKTTVTFDGRETAPATATGNRFLDAEGKGLPRDQRVLSGLSVGVPGNIALAAEAHAKYGKLPWQDLFEPAIALARDGFVMNVRLNGSLAETKGRSDKTAEARAIYFDANGDPLPVGTRITVPALAQFLEQVQEDGAEGMYGDYAQALAEYVAAETPQDGRMSVGDLARYEAKQRPAVCAPYREFTVCGMGPPSSGGVAVAQMLGQLERFDLSALGPNNPEFWHLFVESQRIAYADRELYIGDSDYVPVPTYGLVDPDYMASRGALIDPDTALQEVTAGTPMGVIAQHADGNEPPENGTTHFSVVDAKGNAVSYTSTIEGAFGSGLFFNGFYLNNELTDFSLNPEIDGKPVANRVEGGKRPRSSMAPTIVFNRDGDIVLVIGAAGGPTIPVQVARSIIGVLDFGMGAEQALGMPFIMSYGSSVMIEEGTMLESMQDALKARGHTNIRTFSPSLKANALLRRANGTWESARDPRIEAKLAYEPNP